MEDVAKVSNDSIFDMRMTSGVRGDTQRREVQEEELRPSSPSHLADSQASTNLLKTLQKMEFNPKDILRQIWHC